MSRFRRLFNFLNRADGSVSERVTRSTFWTTSSSALNNLLRFGAQVAVARLLLPEHIGLMGIALFFTRLLDVFSQPGLSSALIQRDRDPHDVLDTVWTTLIARGFLLGALLAAAAPLMAGFYEQPELTGILRVLALAFVLQGFTNAHLIVLRKELDFRRLAFADGAASVVHFVVVLMAAWWMRSVWALVIGQIALALARVVASYLVAPSGLKLELDWGKVRELFRFGRYVTLNNIVVYVAAGIDRAIAGKLLGVVPVGYFVYSHSLAGLPSTNTIPILRRIAFPAMSRLQKAPDELERFYLRGVRILAAVVFPASAGIVLLAPDFVFNIYGSRWMPVVEPARALCLFAVLQVFATVTSPVLMALGRPALVFAASVARLAVLLLLIFPLTKSMGILGTAFAVTAASAVEAAVLGTLAMRLAHISAVGLTRSLAPASAATAIMAGALVVAGERWHNAGTPTHLAGAILLGVAVYSVAILLLDRTLVDLVRSRIRPETEPR